MVVCVKNVKEVVSMKLLKNNFNFKANIQPSKPKFDEAYRLAWHCFVGKDFESCISHLCGSYIFFHVEMEFLIFKDGNDFSKTKKETIGVQQKAKKIYS